MLVKSDNEEKTAKAEVPSFEVEVTSIAHFNHLISFLDREVSKLPNQKRGWRIRAARKTWGSANIRQSIQSHERMGRTFPVKVSLLGENVNVEQVEFSSKFIPTEDTAADVEKRKLRKQRNEARKARKKAKQ